MTVPVLLTVFMPQTHVFPSHGLQFVSWNIRGNRSGNVPVPYGIVMGVENNILLPVLLPIHVTWACGPRVPLSILFPIEIDFWAVFPIRAPVDVLAIERGHIIFTGPWLIWVVCNGQSVSHNCGCIGTYHFGPQVQFSLPLRWLSVGV